MSDKVEVLAKSYTAVVSDALDSLGLREQVLDPAIRPIFPGATVAGRAEPMLIETADAIPDEPYESYMRSLDGLGRGSVPVIRVDGGKRAAAWGEMFSCAARGAGARGAIVEGLVRDARQITELGFPTFATGFSPLDTLGRADVTEVGEPIVCGGVRVERGDYVFGDMDGVVCIPAATIDDVLAFIADKMSRETGARDDLLAGSMLREVWERYRAL